MHESFHELIVNLLFSSFCSPVLVVLIFRFPDSFPDEWLLLFHRTCSVLNATILVQQPLSLFFSPQIDRSCHEMTLSCNKMIWYNDSWMNHSTFPPFILITNMLPSIDTNNTSLPAHSGHSGLDNILLHHCISGHLILKTPWTTTLSYNRLLELHQSSLSWCRYFHSV